MSINRKQEMEASRIEGASEPKPLFSVALSSRICQSTENRGFGVDAPSILDTSIR